MDKKPAARTINSTSNQRVALPSDVREENTAFTTIYEQGKMIYDGATARSGDPRAAALRAAAAENSVPGSLNEMLKWGISNSDPEQLQKMAQSGRQPSQIDREVMDMLLGEPIVAKMRACLGKLPSSDGELPNGLEVAFGAMEELEYYVEDIDNAVDMAKIGGLQALMGCLTSDRMDPELREAACGVLAVSLQNNPKVQDACVTHEVLGPLLSLLHGVDEAQLLPLRQKALLAISALVRSSSSALDQLIATPSSLSTLVSLAAEADAKLRRRALFLLLNLSRDAPSFARLLHGIPDLCSVLMEAGCAADEDTREQALLLMLLLSEGEGASDFRDGLLAVDATTRLAKVAADKGMVGEGEGNPEHAKYVRMLLAWLSGAD